MTGPTVTAPTRSPSLSPWVRQTLELLALSAFAVAQPIFDVLGRHATFFVASRASVSGLVAFATFLILAPPLVLMAMTRGVHLLSAAAGESLHRIWLGVLAGIAVAPPIARALDLGPAGWTGVAVLAGVLVVAAHHRYKAVREAMLWAAISPEAFLVVFLLGSPVRQMLLPETRHAARASAGADVPVALLVFDELALGSLLRTDGALDASRYPNFARLAAQSIWYQNATTNAESTIHAVPALLTGQRPTETKVPTAAAFPDNLLMFLGGTYQVSAEEFVTTMCPPAVCAGRESRGFWAILADAGIVYLHAVLPAVVAQASLPPLGGRWAGFASTARAVRTPDGEAGRGLVGSEPDEVAQFEKALGRVDVRQSVGLHYLHVGVPHLPWTYLPTGQAYNGAGVLGLLPDEEWADAEVVVHHGLQRYLLQLALADRLLGRWLDRLEAQDGERQTMLVVTADHGVSFQAGGNRRILSEQNAADILPIPLFVRYPGQRAGAVDQRPAELVDVLPTIADILQMAVPWRMDGASLRGPVPVRHDRQALTNRRGVLRFPLELEGRDRLSAQIDRLFGPPSARDDVYRFGPFRDLVGRPAADLETEMPGLSGVSVDLRGSPPGDVNASSPFVPVLVTGSLRGALPTSTPIAVALDGVVAGLGWTYSEGTQTQLAVMVAPRFLGRGRPRIDVYQIMPEGKLQALPARYASRFRRVTGAGMATDIELNGRRMPVGGAGLIGHIDRMTVGERSIQLSGWAIDERRQRVPKLFLATRADLVVGSAQPSPRLDVAELFKLDALARSGLQVTVPLPDGSDPLEVYAVYEDAAYRLPRMAGLPPLTAP